MPARLGFPYSDKGQFHRSISLLIEELQILHQLQVWQGYSMSTGCLIIQYNNKMAKDK